MREKFDEDLMEIQSLIAREAIILNDIYEIIKSFLDDETDEKLDDLIDKTDDLRKTNSRIENFSMELMALQQPVAGDLRFLQMAIKFASNSNRISNYIEQMALILKEYKLHDKAKEYVREFADILEEMAEMGIKGFVEKDASISRENIKRDDKVDQIFHESIIYLTDLIKENKISPEEVAEKILFFKYFERLGDRLARISNLALRQ